jgi:hypothetical protein
MFVITEFESLNLLFCYKLVPYDPWGSICCNYCKLVKYLFILCSQICFLAAEAEITNQPKSKQITINRGDFMYQKLTSWLVPKEHKQ